MQKFYDNILNKKMGKAEALKNTAVKIESAKNKKTHEVFL